MDNKNNVIIVLLIVLIGIMGGIGFLLGINNAVSVAISPINAKLVAVEKDLKDLDNKLNSGKIGNVSSSINQIQKQLNQIKSKIDNISTNGGGRQAPQPQMPPPEDLNKVYNIPAGDSPILGNKNAQVTITEFSDFQCPFCSRFYPAIKDVLGAYPNQVRVVIKNFPLPFHPNARPAAKMALAANEQGKFQGMMEQLLANGGDVSEDKVKDYAKTLGLDYNRLMSDYKNKDSQWESKIQNDMQLASSVDVRGTPTFYLNGRKTNARDLSSFKSEIDPLLK